MASPGKWRTQGTRELLIRLLQEQPKTVDQLSGALGITPNAVRSQLTILERDGFVAITGEQRGPRRPSLTYGLTPAGVRLLSQAYAPALKAILKALSKKNTGKDTEEILRAAGSELAAQFGPLRGDFSARIAGTVELLEGLGGVLRVEEAEEGLVLRGQGCPLSEAVEAEPRTCKCMETLISELTGAQVEERCERGEQKRCTFMVRKTKEKP